MVQKKTIQQVSGVPQELSVLLKDKLFLKLINAFNIGISIIASDGTILYFNDSEYKIFDIDRHKNYIGKNLNTLFSTTKTGFFPAVNSKKMNTHPTISHTGVEGITWRTPITDESGKVICCVVETLTTTLEKNNLDALLESIQILKEKIAYYDKKNFDPHGILYTFDNIIGETPIMEEMKSYGRRFARSPASILVVGESGTGKELVAQALHMASSRAGKPFISVNCAALPPNLIESELFGYADGAFTGSKSGGLKGKFELADTGTIFLDEISELPLPMQSKLLRVIENKEVQKIGSGTPVYTDFRLVAATNRDLGQLVKEKAFREDLYHRLNILELRIPPLRERKADIPLLAEHLLREIAGDQRAKEIRFSREVLHFFQQSSWTGNVRELKNIITSALCSMDTTEYLVEAHHLPARFLKGNRLAEINGVAPFASEISLVGVSNHVEKQTILMALKRNNNNKSRTAKELGISRNGLYKKMHKLGLTT